MKKIKEIKSTMMPLKMSNVDTDQIMPKQFLKRVERSGYGEYLFYDWRKDSNGNLNQEFPFAREPLGRAFASFGSVNKACHVPTRMLVFMPVSYTHLTLPTTPYV